MDCPECRVDLVERKVVAQWEDKECPGQPFLARGAIQVWPVQAVLMAMAVWAAVDLQALGPAVGA